MYKSDFTDEIVERTLDGSLCCIGSPGEHSKTSVQSRLVLSSDDIIGLLLQSVLLQSGLQHPPGRAQPQHSEVTHRSEL